VASKLKSNVYKKINIKEPVTPSTATTLGKYTESEYHEYLKTRTIFAFDHLEGFFEELPSLVSIT